MDRNAVKLFTYNDHSLWLDEDRYDEEMDRYWTMQYPDGREEAIDFTQNEKMTEESFIALVEIGNIKRVNPVVPWNNESLKEHMRNR